MYGTNEIIGTERYATLDHERAGETPEHKYIQIYVGTSNTCLNLLCTIHALIDFRFFSCRLSQLNTEICSKNFDICPKQYTITFRITYSIEIFLL